MARRKPLTDEQMREIAESIERKRRALERGDSPAEPRFGPSYDFADGYAGPGGEEERGE
ncbi:hypothetical protein [Salinisphaera dokdonensis]|uniref:hypothetical protein n=1 Tax=Salinisphaera dokdonensis TaxID=454598 RepID=UPI00333EE85F